jgi:UDP-glucose:(heptosyl)LPS alpha-1,3-glucosyltransferase
MRLCIIARPFAFHGGVERATAGLVDALVEHGHAVEILTFGEQAPRPGVITHRLRLPPVPSAARLLAVALGARVVVARGTWDVVQSHERTLSQDVYRAGEGCHRAYLAAIDGGSGRPLYHRLVLALERRLFASTPRIVAIARTGAAEIARWYGVPPSALTVVYNGVDLARFHPRNRATLRDDARGEAGLGPADLGLLFVGSGFARKGLRTALEALAMVAPPTRLLVVGRGEEAPYRALTECLGIAPRVVWLGARADVERWYAAADVVVLPTLYEPFGNVHLEALASGVPVVTSTQAGGAELIQEGVNGVVVAPRDASALAGAIARLRARDARDVAEAARRSAEPYTYAAQVAGFERVYRALGRLPTS